MNNTSTDVSATRGSWKLQDAKARFSEVVRLASEAGPQHVTVNGKEKAVILSAQDYWRLRGEPTGAALVGLFAEVDFAGFDFEHPKTRGPIRDIAL
jgi:antitoxin Phd